MAQKGAVKLRKRKMPSGNISLYLDVYLKGRRSYEYLNLYLVPENSRQDKIDNKETLRLAEAVLAKRIVEFQNGRYGFEDTYKQEGNFLDYYRAMCAKRRGNTESLGNWGNWYSALKHLEEYCKPNTTFNDITPRWVEGFRDYLDRTSIRRDKRIGIVTKSAKRKLSQNSKLSYFNKLKACLSQAVRDGIIHRNPADGVESFKPDETERVYLTLDEVKAMAKAECAYPDLKRAFLFSCLTGLRKSDIEKMLWSEVQSQGEYTRIIFKQKKTGGQEYLDISPQAVVYMGERGELEERVFSGFKYSAYINAELRMWAVRAGITKRITFHSGRHTFAVLMLDLGADIYTVQKLLGHKELHTTQIYAKVLDKKKQEAVMMIPKIVGIEIDD